MERALDATESVLAVVRDELAPQARAELRTASARTAKFAVAAAITDGRAVPVPVSFGQQYSEELTGDWVNVAFDLVKWADAGTVGISWEISRWLTENNASSLQGFSWHDPEEIPLAGASRRILQGTPITPQHTPRTTATAGTPCQKTLPAST
jgi:class 3 adenylate cyclase